MKRDFDTLGSIDPDTVTAKGIIEDSLRRGAIVAHEYTRGLSEVLSEMSENGGDKIDLSTEHCGIYYYGYTPYEESWGVELHGSKKNEKDV